MANSEGVVSSSWNSYNYATLPIMALIGGFTAFTLSFNLRQSLWSKNKDKGVCKEAVQELIDKKVQTLLDEKVKDLVKRTDDLMKKLSDIEKAETEEEMSEEQEQMETKPTSVKPTKKVNFARSTLKQGTKTRKTKAAIKKAKGKSGQEETNEFADIPDSCPFSAMIREQKSQGAAKNETSKKKKEIDLGDMNLVNDLEKFYADKLVEDTQVGIAEDVVEPEDHLPPARVDEVALKVLRNSNSLQPNLEFMETDEKELEAKTRMQQLDRMLKLLEENEEAFTKIPDGPTISCREDSDEEEYRFRVLEDDGSYSNMPVQDSFRHQLKLYGL